MTAPSGPDPREYIARVARAIWESEGWPDGRDHEHWAHAKQLIEDGRAEAEFPEAVGAGRPLGPGPAPGPAGFRGRRARDMRGQIVDHQRTVELLIWEVGQDQDVDMRRFASATSHAVLDHLVAARVIVARLSGIDVVEAPPH